jgi:hypothetical protein
VKDYGLVAYWSLKEALDGDFSRLAKRVRRGELSEDERAFLADWLEGKIKLRRPKSGSKTARQRDEIVQTVLYAHATHPGRKLKDAIVLDVARAFHVSPRYVFKLMSEIDPARREAIEAGAAAYAEFIGARK